MSYGLKKELNLVMMTTDNLKRKGVINVWLGNSSPPPQQRKFTKTAANYLKKYYTYGIPLSQGDNVYHPIIAVFSRILQISQKKKLVTAVSS